MILDIYLTAIVVAIACALPGVFLVVRGTTMLSDAITHSVLLGIVLAFFITPDLNSPFLLIGATLIGLVVVWLIESLQQTKLMSNDAAIGVVFPLFFSLGIILISRYAYNIHLDTDSVLMGELAFVPFRRAVVFGQDIGPSALWRMIVILILNAAFITLFYKELKVSTFDPAFARSLGFSPVLIHYGLMGLVSLTAVGAYDSVGSILVVAFMAGPALTGFLLTNRLSRMILIAIIVAIFNSALGVSLAFQIDVSIAGMIATVTGVTAFLAFLFSPVKGLVYQRRQHTKQKQAFNDWLAKQEKN